MMKHETEPVPEAGAPVDSELRQPPYCVCGYLRAEHPTFRGCTTFRGIQDHVQLAAVILQDAPRELIAQVIANFGLATVSRTATGEGSRR
jgi:hypothetical protein